MKVLIITPNIPEYRFPVFKLLAEKVDLTVLHSGNKFNKADINFKQILVKLKQLGPFTFFPRCIQKICISFDVVISEANIRHVDRDLLIVNPYRTYKWISWGIGVSASYSKKFDSDSSLDIIRHLILKKADASVFYSDYPVTKYMKAGFLKESLFVANNTTYVSYNESADYTKQKILFVGTLYKQKQICKLLKSYKEAVSKTNNIIPLHIIGSGPEYDVIKNWIKENELEGEIKLLGPIYNDSLLEIHFRTSFACISPGQAGLSVLTSMGYGTPFITKKDAITGGEIFNIKNNVNGLIYLRDEELESIILEICNNPNRFIKMGIRAREYYLLNRQISAMVEGLIDAIEYVSHCKLKPLGN